MAYNRRPTGIRSVANQTTAVRAMANQTGQVSPKSLLEARSVNPGSVRPIPIVRPPETRRSMAPMIDPEPSVAINELNLKYAMSNAFSSPMTTESPRTTNAPLPPLEPLLGHELGENR